MAKKIAKYQLTKEARALASRAKKFRKEYNALCNKYDIILGSCGCCDGVQMYYSKCEGDMEEDLFVYVYDDQGRPITLEV
jgi:hypothetical protein